MKTKIKKYICISNEEKELKYWGQYFRIGETYEGYELGPSLFLMTTVGTIEAPMFVDTECFVELKETRWLTPYEMKPTEAQMN